MSLAPLTSTHRAIRQHLLGGIALVLFLVFGVGGWAATSEIAGAIVASGLVVVDSKVKRVQHPSGGIVGEIRVEDGDIVQKGDILVRLDDTILKANLGVVTKEIVELGARKARLEAERDGLAAIAVKGDIRLGTGELDVEGIVAGEKRLFELRLAARTGQKQQLRQRVDQLKGEIEGLRAQIGAKNREIELVGGELEEARNLWRQNLVSLSKLNSLERDAARLEGERGQLTSSIAQTEGRVSETELQVIQIDRELASEVAKEMREIDGRLGELAERRVAAEDQLSRVEIRAPFAGFVHQSTVHTVGGVVGAGDTIMLIVPKAERLVVEAKIRPTDIDQLSIGQTARLRFSAFNQRTTPELIGTLDRISPDITTDERSGLVYYTVRVTIEPLEVAKLGAVTLVPGMPVEVFLNTSPRTVLSYLIKPLVDQVPYVIRGE